MGSSTVYVLFFFAYLIDGVITGGFLGLSCCFCQDSTIFSLYLLQTFHQF